MSNYFDDDDDDWNCVYSADLKVADKGYKLCDECGGQGTYMYHKCYPNGPVECAAYCDVCSGDGQVPIEIKAGVSRNKREGWFGGCTVGIKCKHRVPRYCSLRITPKNRQAAYEKSIAAPHYQQQGE